MLAQIGINPEKDVNWTTGRGGDAKDLFAGGKADALMAFAQEPAELRARNVGKVILNTAQDRPWEHYFCCMAAARREFVVKHPIATKRAVRALLKAADICARDPERAARYIVARGYDARYEVALEVIQSLSYDRWRTHDPEDSLRFYGVRLHEVGMIKSSPQKLIAQGSDWQFLNQLKKELKT